MKHFLTYLIAILPAAALLLSCERTSIPEEDSMFIISAAVGTPDENGVPLDIVLREGTVKGSCRASIDVADLTDGSTPPMTVLINGEAAVTPSSVWAFNPDGTAHFLLTGIPKGSYAGTVKVTRWYHTSTDRFNFVIR